VHHFFRPYTRFTIPVLVLLCNAITDLNSQQRFKSSCSCNSFRIVMIKQASKSRYSRPQSHFKPYLSSLDRIRDTAFRHICLRYKALTPSAWRGDTVMTQTHLFALRDKGKNHPEKMIIRLSSTKTRWPHTGRDNKRKRAGKSRA
jgi:hypothetical protein